MARLFTCGFEEYSGASAIVDLTTMWSAVVGSPTYVATSPHSGTYCLECAPAATAPYVRRYLPSGDTAGTYYTRFYVKVVAAGSDASYRLVARCISNGSALNWGIRYKHSTQQFNLINGVDSANSDWSGTVQADTWYRIEIEHKLLDSGGSITAYCYEGDSTTPSGTWSALTGDTLNTNAYAWEFLGVNLASGGCTIRFDDIAINDETTGTYIACDSWCGPGKIAFLEPASDTATVQWTPNTGTDHTALVDDLPGTPDDATTYNGDTQATNVDRLNVGSLPAEVTSDATITLVDVYARVGNSSTSGTPSMILRLWDEGGTSVDGPALSTDINGWRICATSEHLVASGSGKTKANVESYDLGYKGNTADGYNKWITALWANVEWLEAPPSGLPKILMPPLLPGGWR